MNTLIQYLRSVVFYLGYVLLTLLVTSSFILLFLLMSRRLRQRVVAVWVGAVFFWLRLCCRVRYQVHGLHNLPACGPGYRAEQPAVILANHQSSWETFLFYRIIYPMAPILKKELLYIPLFGWGLWLQGAIAIDRGSPLEAGKTVLRDGVKRLRQGISVLVFPEGTRSPPGQICKFSRGGAKLAVAAGVPVVPIAHNAGDCWPRGRLLKKPGLISVVIGAPIDTTEDISGGATEGTTRDTAGQDPSAVTQQVEAWVRTTLANMPSNNVA